MQRLDSQPQASLQGWMTEPRSVGDIVGVAFRITRNNLLEIFKTLLAPTIVITVGRVAVSLGSNYALKGNVFAGNLMWAGTAFGGFVVLLIAAFWLYLRQLALVRYFAGFSSSLAEARVYMSKKVWTFLSLNLLSIGVFILTSIIFGVVFALCILPLSVKGAVGIMAAIAMALSIIGYIVAVVYQCLAITMAMNMLALEDMDAGAILSRSLSFTWRSIWRSLGFGILSTTAVSLISYPINLPVILLTVGYIVTSGTGLSEGNTLPPQIQIISAIWQSVTQMTLGPIYHFACSFYYLDLKMRFEGFDLKQRLEKDARTGGGGSPYELPASP